MKSTLKDKLGSLIGFLVISLSVIYVANTQQAISMDGLGDQQIAYLPNWIPNRVILNLSESPLATLNVNWRTSAAQQTGKVE